jgi:hypothetical protein
MIVNRHLRRLQPPPYSRRHLYLNPPLNPHVMSVILAAPSPAPNPRSPSIEHSREDALAKLTGESQSSATYDYETPLERRGVVVEEDDDAADQDHDPSLPHPTFNVQRPLRHLLESILLVRLMLLVHLQAHH